MGPAEDLTRPSLIMFAVGLACIAAWIVYRIARRRDDEPAESSGLFKLLPGVGLVLVVLSVTAFDSGPSPCQDQGALGTPVGAFAGACDTV